MKIRNLTAHNWQKWKSIFLTCHCHEIYKEEAVGENEKKILLSWFGPSEMKKETWRKNKLNLNE